jgi:hypothetical protein
MGTAEAGHVREMTVMTRPVRREPALLGIYLNDHLAAITGGLELAHRAARAWNAPLADAPPDYPAGLAREMAEDRAALVGIMRTLGFPVRRYKMYAAWAAEKAGRLKLNGHVLSRSPLSDVLELEMLRVTVESTVSCWRTLRALADTDRRLDAARLDDLIARGERHAQTLERLALQASVRVFGAR